MELKDAARAETAKLQSGDPENTELWRLFLRVSLAEFDAVYQRMRVRFDETDAMGIVHHGRYLGFLEIARVEWLRKRGIRYVDWAAAGRHLAVVDAGPYHGAEPRAVEQHPERRGEHHGRNPMPARNPDQLGIAREEGRQRRGHVLPPQRDGRGHAQQAAHFAPAV